MTTTTTSSLFDWKFSLKLAFFYILAKIKFIHGWLPETWREQLPTGWNNQMFWVAFKSGGKTVYYEYYCRLKEPKSYKPRASVAPEFQLTEKQIRGFYENGYVGPFDLLPPDEMDNLREYLVNSLLKTESKCFSFTAGDYEFDTTKKDDLLTAWNQEITEDYQKYIVNAMNEFDRHLEEDRLMNLFKHPAITERAAQLLGPNLLLWRTKFFGIQPGLATKLHQASTFFANQQESIMYPEDHEYLYQLTCWIAVTDANKENGCMMIFPGTHKEIYPIKVGEVTQDGMSGIYGNRDAKLDYPGELPQPHYIEMKAGQFYLFTERVIHGSVENKTDKSRWGLNGRIATTSTRIYTKKMLEGFYRNRYSKVKNINLDKWKVVLLRGEDSLGYNRYTEKLEKKLASASTK
ncbi:MULTISPECIES: phytanoyl-CoA dioxygenase family protein [unclassified Microcoleus]|uniref:phytanoyl-CoA dioxygenase family protein n=1 Tax=unclassified Microcoleus TaxID=2642155 RepID=UPI002FD3D4FB